MWQNKLIVNVNLSVSLPHSPASRRLGCSHPLAACTSFRDRCVLWAGQDVQLLFPLLFAPDHLDYRAALFGANKRGGTVTMSACQRADSPTALHPPAPQNTVGLFRYLAINDCSRRHHFEGKVGVQRDVGGGRDDQEYV